MVALATAGTYGYFASQSDVYTASTSIFVEPAEPILSDTQTPGTDRNTANQAALLQSRDVAKRVAGELGFSGEPTALVDRVEIEAETGSDFVKITGRGPTGEAAARLTNAFSKAFIAIRGEDRRKDVARALRSAQAQLDKLGRGARDAAARSSAAEDVRRLRLTQSLPTGSAQQVDPALPPGRPSAPRPVRNALFALVLSLVLALGMAFGLERFDRRIKRIEDIEGVYGAPLLAVLPHVRDAAPMVDDQATLGPAFKESFRALRTNIQLTGLDRPHRRLLVISAIPGEGKSTVVRNLAIAYREWGLTVAVVEADLRRPTLARLFQVDPKVGLTDVLVGNETLEGAVHTVAVEVPGVEALVHAQAQGDQVVVAEPAGIGAASSNGGDPTHLSLLTSGPSPGNPPAILATKRMETLVEELSATHEVVLIDSAPMLAVTDTAPLLPRVDGIVIVGRLGITTTGVARQLMTLVRRINGAEVLGIVANDRAQLDSGSDYGYYGNGYYSERV
jgi:Mrp family chromosome partitioning ATPase